MKERVLEKLEFTKIRQLLASYCTFAPSQERALRLTPSSDRRTVVQRLREVDEARKLLATRDLGGRPLKDVRSYVDRAARQGILTGEALRDIADFLDAQAALGRAAGESDLYPLLHQMAKPLRPLPELSRFIRSRIADDGSVREDASPELVSLAQRVRELQERIRRRLTGLARSYSRKGFLQEDWITLREGRFVLPVRADQRSEIPGIVHGTSGSGATVFIEPAAIIERNNELRVATLRMQQEIERILQETSRQVGEAADALRERIEAAAELDFALARARLGERLQAVTPVIMDAPSFRFVGARHPLLGEKAVPIDLELGKQFHILVLTGPNTGGKTVALKTAGLLTLMGQSGLQVPCEAAEMGVFREVFADIGDEQSIEQSLSTFSGHFQHILQILPRADRDTLVLLDELGAGTDPEEGAALAEALLEEFRRRSVRVVVTTHFGPLKTYAYRVDGVENAGVEFDLETLRPTYRVILGSPGKSNALEIAGRLGLSPDIISRARSRLSRASLRVEEAIEELEAARRQLEKERLCVQRERSEAQRWKEAWRERADRIERERERFRERARLELLPRLHQAIAEAEELVRALRRQMRDGKPGERLGQETLRQLRELRRRATDSLEAALSEKTGEDSIQGSEGVQDGGTPPDVAWQPGDRVWIEGMNGQAQVLEPADTSGNVFVQIGRLKVRLPEERLRAFPPGKEREPSRRDPSHRGRKDASDRSTHLPSWTMRTVAPEIHLRGMTIDEAAWVLEKYLDDAVLAGLSEVRIIHGKGTGTLRRWVHETLSAHSRVKHFRIGEAREGGIGVTVAYLE